MEPPSRIRPPVTAGSRSSRSCSMLRPSASARRVAVGAVQSAPASSAVRVGRGSARSRSAEQALEAGSGAECPVPGELQGVQRVAARRHRDRAQLAAGERDVELLADHVEEGLDRERVEADLGAVPVGQPFLHRPAARARPGHDQHRQVTQPGQGLAERRGGRVVEPLGVVHQDDERLRRGQVAEHAAHGQRDRAGLGAVAVVEEQRGADRRSLGRRERVVLLRGKRRQQLTERGEREPALGLERSRGQDGCVATGQRIAERDGQCALAHPGRRDDGRRRRPRVREPIRAREQRDELGVPTDDDPHRSSLVARRPRDRGNVNFQLSVLPWSISQPASMAPLPRPTRASARRTSSGPWATWIPNAVCSPGSTTADSAPARASRWACAVTSSPAIAGQ